jgi:hypothetical protein
LAHARSQQREATEKATAATAKLDLVVQEGAKRVDAARKKAKKDAQVWCIYIYVCVCV